MRRRTLERVIDAVAMILRVFLEVGVPGNFLTENEFAVDGRGAFSVGAAEVETDSASVKVPAERHGGLFRFRSVRIGAGYDLHPVAVNASHHGVIERAFAFGRIDFRKFFGNFRISGDCDLPASSHPEKPFHETFDVPDVRRHFGGVGVVEYDGRINTDAFGIAFNGDNDILAFAGGFDRLAELSVPEGRRNEIFVETRDHCT